MHPRFRLAVAVLTQMMIFTEESASAEEAVLSRFRSLLYLYGHNIFASVFFSYFFTHASLMFFFLSVSFIETPGVD